MYVPPGAWADYQSGRVYEGARYALRVQGGRLIADPLADPLAGRVIWRVTGSTATPTAAP